MTQANDNSREPQPQDARVYLAGKASARWLYFALLMTLLTTLATTGFVGYVYFIQKSTTGGATQEEIARIKQTLENESKNLDNLRKEVAGHVENLGDSIGSGLLMQNEALRDVQKKITSDIKEVSDLNKFNTREYRSIQQALHLLQAAHISLLLSGNNLRATQYLQRADEILNNHDDPLLTPARKELTRYLFDLAANNTSSDKKYYFLLDNLITKLQELPLQLVWAPKEETSQTSDNSVTDRILSLFRVRVQDNPVVRSEQIIALTYQRLILILEQAQIAVLRNQQDIYDNAITKAQTILGKYLDKKNPDVVFLATRLDELAAGNVTLMPADVSQILVLLERYRDLRYASSN